jgi:pimeloyl-ACP methyl ester carboxylesterase
MTISRSYQPLVAREENVLHVRGIDYCINEWGDENAPLFFYLHGWADTGSTFQFVVDALKSRWRIVAPDWRGFGRTSHTGGPYWFPDYLADLHEILNHYSLGSPVSLVGHSMGGNVASLYAGAMPERVNKIVNVEGFGLADSDPNNAPHRFREWLVANEAQVEFTSYPDFDNLAQKIKKRNPALDDARADFIAREWAADVEGTIQLRADPNHRLPNAVLYRRQEAEACWRNVSADVLLVRGGQSPFAGEIDDIRDLPFPKSEICTIPDVGHMLHFETPVCLAEQIEAFLLKPL